MVNNKTYVGDSLSYLDNLSQSDRKGSFRVSKCKSKKYLFGYKAKEIKASRSIEPISLVEDYYEQSSCSVANQNAGFELVH